MWTEKGRAFSLVGPEFFCVRKEGPIIGKTHFAKNGPLNMKHLRELVKRSQLVALIASLLLRLLEVSATCVCAT